MRYIMFTAILKENRDAKFCRTFLTTNQLIEKKRFHVCVIRAIN